jgi:manganese transport protein
MGGAFLERSGGTLNGAVIVDEPCVVPPAPLRAAPAGGSERFSLRRLLGFVGPGYLVAVGYLDPGNWATALAGGAAFGYSLLSVLLLSNLMAMLLQAASVRLGVATGLDLAQACRREFGPRVNLFLWVGCEIAIVACNLAEVLGMAWGLNLLFHVPFPIGVGLTALDVFLLLTLQKRGVRYLESVIIALVSLIAACFAVQLWWLHPSGGAVLAGFVPTPRLWRDPAMLYLAIGIVGATVMPHNLYLHSSIVQARRQDGSPGAIRRAISYATVDSNVALGLVLLVNVGIMVLAAGAFHQGAHALDLDIGAAYRLLSPLLGTSAASAIFGIGLVAAGLSSSLTGTLAGQVVMEGYLQLKIPRAARAMVTRGLALIPAAIVAAVSGAAGIGKLMVLSQVVLGIQLPFAVIPLLWFTTRGAYLGEHAFGRTTGVLLWSAAALIVAINAWAILGILKIQ